MHKQSNQNEILRANKHLTQKSGDSWKLQTSVLFTDLPKSGYKDILNRLELLRKCKPLGKF
jgi:hypothetical protein